MNKLKYYLKNNPTTYKYSLWIYKTPVTIKNIIFRVYIKLCEFFIPGSFFVQSSPDLIMEHYPNFRKDNEFYSETCKRVARDGVRLISAKLLLDLVFDLEEGDYAELGTFRGNFARIIFNYKNTKSSLYCFDTFEGFTEEDVNIELAETSLTTKSGHFSDTSLELVTKNIVGNSKLSDQLKLIKGYFPDSFIGLENKKWRFVHLDADLYEPMKEGVRAFWPGIVKGGILLIHDYNGTYKGTKKAIDEYFKPLGITPIPLPDKVGSAVIIKNQI